MSGIHFEHYLAYQFRKLGYRVKVTPPSGDFGADLIIRKWGRKAVVQAKRYQGSVGIKAVQEAIGAREYYKAKQAIVITNSYYTSAAIKLAKASNVVLWDRGHMIEEFGLVEYKHQKELHCPICQSPLVVRNGKFGEFYGCTNYPNCSYTKNID
ncbi:hypothetical protein lbkm_0257 [Lachnospiraceae bacterium KM106-2]|nr:hypothetical protein lbkm_0257 [Lachnospiraceae bacterium KM106-2]